MTAKTIGEKIKSLRKELKMTQSQLVGEQLSKGMLSLVENNLTNPSIKTLNYIASKLGKPISYFIGENSYEVIEKAVTSDVLMAKISTFDELENLSEWDQALEIMHDIESEFITDDNSISSANLLFKFGKFLIKSSRIEESEKYFLGASSIYQSHEMYINAAESYLTTYVKYFNHFDINKCDEILEKTYSIYKKSVYKDPLFEIRFLYKKITHLGYTQRDFEFINIVIDQALDLSNKNDLYYYEELYRCKAYLAVERGKYDEYKESIRKSLDFCELTNSINLKSVLYTIAKGENSFDNPIAALEALEKLELIPYNDKELKKVDIPILFTKTEKAKAYYIMGDYKESERIFESIDYDSKESKLSFNPERLSFLEQKIYYCLLLSKLKKFDEAIDIIEKILAKPEIKDRNRFLCFAYKSLSEIYSDKGDYKAAFKYQKKAMAYIESYSRNITIPKTIDIKKGNEND